MDMRVCAECKHYRLQEPPDPFVGVRLLSAKGLELRTKWQQELAAQAALEEQIYVSGQGFYFEPIAYPWCEHHSSERTTDVISGVVKRVYRLCVERNPDGTCTDFAARSGA
jgi:hypothetical protein